jgi:sugar lactone lactonase YvrE
MHKAISLPDPKRNLIFHLVLVCLGIGVFQTSLFGQSIQYFPQVADGGGYVTTWYFASLGSGRTSVKVELFTPNGAPLPLSTNLGRDSVFTFDIEKSGQTSLRTLGEGNSIQVGWAKINASRPVGATEIFHLFGADGYLLSTAGVLPADPTTTATIIVSNSSSGPVKGTGVALTNVGSSRNNVRLRALNRDGVLVASSGLSLDPGHQLAMFAYQFSGMENLTDFEGTLEISGSSPFSAVTIECEGPELSVIPILPGRPITLEDDPLLNLITTVAGNGTVGFSGDGAQATSASLNVRGSGNGTARVVLDRAGNLFIADTDNHRIRKVDAATGIITTVAGDGFKDSLGLGRYNGDGIAATSASLNCPSGVATDKNGNIFIADKNNGRIRKVDTLGIITTVAGNGMLGDSPGDGNPATSAHIGPIDVAVDSSGNVFIADMTFNRVRKVNSSTGIITTVAGNGEAGSSGDGGPAISASLGFMDGVSGGGGLALDSQGNIFIAEFKGNRVRMVNAATGIITTVAGSGSLGFSGDGGPAIAASLYNPIAVFVDDFGSIFIADNNHNRIRKVDASTGIITTFAGSGSQGFSGDGGLAIHASLALPCSIAADAASNLYFVDAFNNRVRRIQRASVF